MSQYKNITESGVITTRPGMLNGFIVATHSSGTLKLYDGPEAGANAVGTITQSVGAATPAFHATNTLTSTGAMVAGTHATSVLTGNAIVAGNVVVIGAITYTFKTTLTENYDVLVGATLTASLLNLKNAINGATAQGGFHAFTPAHTQVIATASDATTVTVFGRVPGTSLNSVATTGTALRTVWADTTLGGGTGASDAGVTTGAATCTIGTTVYTVVDILSETLGATAVAYQVLKGANEAAMLSNLKKAINGTGTVGTEYSTGTVAHADIVATTLVADSLIVRARFVGDNAYTAIVNAIATTETMANTAWTAVNMGAGTGASDPSITTTTAGITIGTREYIAVLELDETLTGVAKVDQILWVSDEATFLDNIKLAINASGIAGTNYSTGTTQNTQVKATTNGATTQVIQALNTGVAGNSIATTATLTNYAWGGTTLASGTAATAEVLVGTITFPAVTVGPLTYNFPEPLSFKRGLYAAIGGTSADITIQYN